MVLNAGYAGKFALRFASLIEDKSSRNSIIVFGKHAHGYDGRAAAGIFIRSH